MDFYQVMHDQIDASAVSISLFSVIVIIIIVVVIIIIIIIIIIISFIVVTIADNECDSLNSSRTPTPSISTTILPPTTTTTTTTATTTTSWSWQASAEPLVVIERSHRWRQQTAPDDVTVEQLSIHRLHKVHPRQTERHFGPHLQGDLGLRRPLPTWPLDSSTHSATQLSTHTFIHPNTYPSIHTFIRPITYPSIHSSTILSSMYPLCYYVACISYFPVESLLWVSMWLSFVTCRRLDFFYFLSFSFFQLVTLPSSSSSSSSPSSSQSLIINEAYQCPTISFARRFQIDEYPSNRLTNDDDDDDDDDGGNDDDDDDGEDNHNGDNGDRMMIHCFFI